MKYKKIIIIATIILCGILFYLWYENNIPQINYYKFTNAKIPKEFDNFKIAHLSDYHNNHSQILNDKIINKLKSEKPDIIVFTGDLVDANSLDMDTAISFIDKIDDIAPIYYINGNHEIAIDFQELKNKLNNKNITILENQTKYITKKNKTISINGISDPLSNSIYNVTEEQYTRIELNTLNHDKAQFNILLAHRPEKFDIYNEYHYDIVYTGHAHGGQIRIPLIGGLYAPHQGWFPSYTASIYTKKYSTMIVSQGIGNSRFPFRINNRPEISFTTLQSIT